MNLKVFLKFSTQVEELQCDVNIVDRRVVVKLGDTWYPCATFSGDNRKRIIKAVLGIQEINTLKRMVS